MNWEGLRDTDVVVIPALNEEGSIGGVVRYLMKQGLQGQQLVIVDSGSTDDTARVALGTARIYPTGRNAQLVRAAELLGDYRHKTPGECGTPGCDGLLQTRGKGAAMYAATLVLTQKRHPPSGRLFFLDGDITNPSAVDPIGCLLKAWEHNPHARIVKLASDKRENEGMLAYINLLPPPYNSLSNLAWPLCGQQSLELGFLQRIPLPADYSVEVALLAALAELYGGDCFAQEPISAALKEEQHPHDLQKFTRMFTGIMLFLQNVVEKGPLNKMGHKEVCAWNRGAWREVSGVGVPRVSRKNHHRETITVDALLPPVVKLTA